MDKYDKYIKYKNKYINLKNKLQIGGNRDILVNIYREFFNKYFEIFIGSELKSIFLEKYFRDLDIFSITEEKIFIDHYKIKSKIDEIKEMMFKRLWNTICDDIIRLFDIFYSKMILGQHKSNINIFSYSTGAGFFEALFAIYLKILHKKIDINIMFCDLYNSTDILTSYVYTDYSNDEHVENKVFNHVFGLYQKYDWFKSYHTPISLIQLEMLLSRLYNKEVLKPKIVDYFIDSNFSSIEIFISVNAQRFSYQYNKQISDHILFINLFVNLLTKRKEIQQQIPMIWLYCDYRLNFENFERLKESMMLINERFYEKKEGLEYFSFSTLDNLKETGNFPPIKKEVLQREY